MISVTKLRNGTLFELQGNPWRVLEYKHVHLSRGSGTITIRAKNLKSGNVQAHTFKSGDKVQEAEIERRELTFLYGEGNKFALMDPVSFEQIEIEKRIAPNLDKFILEGEKAAVLFWEEQAIDVEIPLKVELSVSEASPGVRGDTVAGATKEVKLETGIKVKVPLFIEKGNRIVVDTRSGEYVQRA